jgi:hypothetical protein
MHARVEFKTHYNFFIHNILVMPVDNFLNLNLMFNSSLEFAHFKMGPLTTVEDFSDRNMLLYF